MLKTVEQIEKDIKSKGYSLSDMPIYISQMQDEAYNLGHKDGKEVGMSDSDEHNFNLDRTQQLTIEREKFQFAVDVLDEVMFDKWKAIDKRGSLIAEVHRLTPTIGPTLLDQ